MPKLGVACPTRCSRSRSSDGQAFTGSTAIPSRIGVMQARAVGSPSALTMQFGHWPAQQSRPRGRWYLKERESTRTPEACSAEAMVSPR